MTNDPPPKYFFDRTIDQKNELKRVFRRNCAEPNKFTTMAEKREKIASQLSDKEIWTAVARNILKNKMLSDEMKVKFLVSTIPDMDIINNSILMDYEENHNNWISINC